MNSSFHDKLSPFDEVYDSLGLSVFEQNRLLPLVRLKGKVCEHIIIFHKAKRIFDLNKFLISLNQLILSSLLSKFHKFYFVVAHRDVIDSFLVEVFARDQASFASHLLSRSHFILVSSELSGLKSFRSRYQTWHVRCPSVGKLIALKLGSSLRECFTTSAYQSRLLIYSTHLHLGSLSHRNFADFVIVKITQGFFRFFVSSTWQNVVTNSKSCDQVSQIICFVSILPSNLLVVVLGPLGELVAVFLDKRSNVSVFVF